MDAGVSRFYRSPSAMYARLEDLQCSWLKTPARRSTSLNAVPSTWSLARRSTRLETVPSIGLPACRLPRLKKGVVHWITGSSLDETHNGTDYWATGSPCGKTNFAGSECYPTRADLSPGASSRNLYKLCLSGFDGRHNLACAGTYLNPKNVHVSWTWKILLCI